MFALGLAALSGLIGAGVMAEIYVLGGLTLSTGVWIGGGIGGFIIGWIVANMMVSCLDSGVSMVFVCFAEDDNTLRVNHLETYDKLAGSWERFNPGSLRWTGANVETANPMVQARVIESHSYPPHYTAPSQHSHGYQGATSAPPPMNPYYSNEAHRNNKW